MKEVWVQFSEEANSEYTEIENTIFILLSTIIKPTKFSRGHSTTWLVIS